MHDENRCFHQVASIAGMFFGAAMNNAIGGMILFVLISGIACIIHSLNK